MDRRSSKPVSLSIEAMAANRITALAQVPAGPYSPKTSEPAGGSADCGGAVCADRAMDSFSEKSSRLQEKFHGVCNAGWESLRLLNAEPRLLTPSLRPSTYPHGQRSKAMKPHFRRRGVIKSDSEHSFGVEITPDERKLLDGFVGFLLALGFIGWLATVLL